MSYQDTTMLSTLTVADLRTLFREFRSERKDEILPPSGRLVFGLRGIQSLFNCSHKQAQFYKDHVIQEAVSQNGRKIVVDADKALELFNQRKAK